MLSLFTYLVSFPTYVTSVISYNGTNLLLPFFFFYLKLESHKALE